MREAKHHQGLGGTMQEPDAAYKNLLGDLDPLMHIFGKKGTREARALVSQTKHVALCSGCTFDGNKQVWHMS